MARERKTTPSGLDSLRPATFVVALAMMLATAFLAAPAADAQTYTVLHSFTGVGDGGVPGTNLVMDRAGNLYGTTYDGGTYGLGGVFKLAHGRSGWVLDPLHDFTATDGSSPSSLIMGRTAPFTVQTRAAEAEDPVAAVAAGPSLNSPLRRPCARASIACGRQPFSIASPDRPTEPLLWGC